MLSVLWLTLIQITWNALEMFFSYPPQPTRDDRGWIINPVGPNPWWTTIITFIPALLCTILIFMDQQITAVIINRKEHKLKVRWKNLSWEILVTQQENLFPIIFVGILATSVCKCVAQKAWLFMPSPSICRKAVATTWTCLWWGLCWVCARWWVCRGSWPPPSCPSPMWTAWN